VRLVLPFLFSRRRRYTLDFYSIMLYTQHNIKERWCSLLTVSNNSTATFRSCPMKWRWRYIEGLRPKKLSNKVTLGKAVHDMFHLHYSNKPVNEIISHVNDLYKKELEEAPIENHHALMVDWKTALGMFLNYPNKSLNFEKIKSEEEFNVTIDGVRRLRFIGRVDGLVKHQGTWWIRELKVTGMDMRQFEGRAQTSSQATGYIYAMHKKTRLPIEGVMYDAIKRPLLRIRKTETTEEFAERIYEDYKLPEKKDMYFLRYFTYRSPLNMKQWEGDMALISRQIRKCFKYDVFYRNTDSCWQYGTECPYLKVCFEDKPDPILIEHCYDKVKGEDK